MANESPQPRQRLTHADYFALEEATGQRYEYLAGEVFAMTGGTETHALISANTLAALVGAFRGTPCRVYGPDLKLYLATYDKYCYPDVMVVCASDKRNPRYVENPSLIVEVLSESTSGYDRGLKFEHYRSIAALRYYLLLSQERPYAELFHREQDHWTLRESSGEEGTLALADWNIVLPLAELHRNVEFPT